MLIIPRDTESDQGKTFEAASELYSKGVRIFIGPVFNENLNALSKFQDAIFLSLTNKTIGNPKPVFVGFDVYIDDVGSRVDLDDEGCHVDLEDGRWALELDEVGWALY